MTVQQGKNKRWFPREDKKKKQTNKYLERGEDKRKKIEKKKWRNKKRVQT